MFDPQRQQQLLDLAFQGALGGEEQVLGNLLGDGAAPLHDASGPGVGHRGARQADQINAKMTIETPVFHGEHGHRQHWRQFAEANRHPVKVADGGYLAAIGGEKPHRGGTTAGQGTVDIGQVEGIPRNQSTGGDDAPHRHHHRPIGEAP